MALLDRIVVPIASEADARETARALDPLLADVDRITALHVIEKAGGAIDKAPMEKRRSDAEEFLAVFEDLIEEPVAVETRIAFGTDVVETIFEVATAADATAIAMRPRSGSRLTRLLTGDTASRLVTEPEFPVVSVPNPAEE